MTQTRRQRARIIRRATAAALTECRRADEAGCVPCAEPPSGRLNCEVGIRAWDAAIAAYHLDAARAAAWMSPYAAAHARRLARAAGLPPSRGARRDQMCGDRWNPWLLVWEPIPQPLDTVR